MNFDRAAARELLRGAAVMTTISIDVANRRMCGFTFCQICSEIRGQFCKMRLEILVIVYGRQRGCIPFFVSIVRLERRRCRKGQRSVIHSLWQTFRARCRSAVIFRFMESSQRRVMTTVSSPLALPSSVHASGYPCGGYACTGCRPWGGQRDTSQSSTRHATSMESTNWAIPRTQHRRELLSWKGRSERMLLAGGP